MKTKREKQLEIALLKEKIERLSNKKVELVLKEDDYYEPKKIVRSKEEVENEIEEFLKDDIDEDSESLYVNHGGDRINLKTKPYKDRKGNLINPSGDVEEFRELANSFITNLENEGYGIYSIVLIGKRGFELEKVSMGIGSNY